ncbi:hypothetical protein IIZ77_00385, partial [Candidatus Saccharibacteria bacterium]|nr:hypothetical protein [Candidatus Saccharibacteria bacterium]
MFYEVIPTKIFRNGSGVLTYASDLNLKTGHLVTIPLGKSSCTGVVLKKVPKPSFPCKPITKLLYVTPLPSHLVKSALWLSTYYLSPLPSCASLLLPIGVEKKRKNKKIETTEKNHQNISIKLNSAQKTALRDLGTIKNNTKLLYGITGSGKTNIYLKLTKDPLEKNQTVSILVP